MHQKNNTQLADVSRQHEETAVTLEQLIELVYFQVKVRLFSNQVIPE